MKTRFRLLPGLSLLLIAVSTQAQSPGVFVDQMQPLVDTSVGGMAIGGPSQEKLSQTVTVGHSGHLRGVFLPIGCDSGRLIVEIRSVEPSGAPGIVLIARRAFPAEQVTVIGPLFRYFKFEDDDDRDRDHDRDLTFLAGSRFAIVLRNPTGTCGIFRGPVGDTYTGGSGFFDALPNPPGWVPFSPTETRLDLPFMTVMNLH
jgi:hypothetical protein